MKVDFLSDFKKKTTWEIHSRANLYRIEVKHWYTDEFKSNDFHIPLTNRWNIYVYFYPKFPCFDKLEESIYEEGWMPISFHGGITYTLFHKDKSNNITAKQYGCDYSHLGDERFNDYDTPEMASEIFYDALKIREDLERIINLKERII